LLDSLLQEQNALFVYKQKCKQWHHSPSHPRCANSHDTCVHKAKDLLKKVDICECKDLLLKRVDGRQDGSSK